MVHDKWHKAVVHIECIGDSVHVYDRMKREREERKKQAAGDTGAPAQSARPETGTNDVRTHGTAVFLEHEGRRYLITSRHVVWDQRSAEREYQEDVKRVSAWPTELRDASLEHSKINAYNEIFGRIVRVPSLDEIQAKQPMAWQEPLPPLLAGTLFSRPYIFSSPELDLAIISLDQRSSRFADELIARGYRPISLADVAKGPSSVGADVFTVGYPIPTSIAGVHTEEQPGPFSSSLVSVPEFAFGKVSMLHDSLNTFQCDMRLSDGNFGGPVVEGDKLVGVVCAQVRVGLDDTSNAENAPPKHEIVLPVMAKAQFIEPLILAQIEKDEFSSNPGKFIAQLSAADGGIESKTAIAALSKPNIDPDFGFSLCTFLAALAALAVAYGTFEARYRAHKEGWIVVVVAMVFAVPIGWLGTEFFKKRSDSRKETESSAVQQQRQEHTEQTVIEARDAILSKMALIVDSKDAELFSKYPYGYVLIGQLRGLTVRFPPPDREGQGKPLEVKADWKNAAITVNRPNNTVTIKVPDLTWSDGVLRINPANLFQTLPLETGKQTLFGVFTPGQVNTFFEVIDANPDEPVVAIGFKIPK